MTKICIVTLQKAPKQKHMAPQQLLLTNLDLLKKDTGLETAELLTAMQDRTLWRAITNQGHLPR